jgi:hypothetical protein
MEEKIIYSKVLERLFEGLKTDKHDKFKNDRLSERKFAVDNLYPDIILTKKGSDTIDFMIEIVVNEHLNKDVLLKKWLPLSKKGPTYYILVPKNKLNQVQKWCEEQKMPVRYGTYEIKDNKAEIKFF